LLSEEEVEGSPVQPLSPPVVTVTALCCGFSMGSVKDMDDVVSEEVIFEKIRQQSRMVRYYRLPALVPEHIMTFSFAILGHQTKLWPREDCYQPGRRKF